VLVVRVVRAVSRSSDLADPRCPHPACKHRGADSTFQQYSEYFIFQLETGCSDPEVVMRYLRAVRGDCVRAVANFQRDTQRSDTAAGREEGAGSGRQLSASRMAGAGGGENRDNGGLLDTADFWYAAPMPRVAPDAECAICLGALITTATSTESPAPGTSSARRSSPAPAAAAAPDDVVALRYCGHVFHLVRVTHSAWHTHAVQPGTGTELI
jgi:hypothetical protein